MSDFDELDQTGGEDAAPQEASPTAEGNEGGVDLPLTCLSCGSAVAGVFCASCGQKNDDLRRSIFVLARNFLEDTFGFDSRMWRTLGLMAVAPGVVPKSYAHGKRSRFTPPVRLFIVVSFLFFLTIGLTNTLFLGLEVEFKEQPQEASSEPVNGASDDAGIIVDAAGMPVNCSFQAKTRFFVKESDLHTNKERMDACMGNLRDQVNDEVRSSDNSTAGQFEDAETEISQAEEIVDRVFNGINWAVMDARAFNDAFNDWLPRTLFLMTPVLALILTLFLRREALVFDHLVLSLYTHAAGFAIVGLSLILAQLGAPYMGMAAFGAVALYYLFAIKRTYGRGWVKTVWTAFMSGIFYLAILLSAVMAIMSNIVWRAAA